MVFARKNHRKSNPLVGDMWMVFDLPDGGLKFTITSTDSFPEETRVLDKADLLSTGNNFVGQDSDYSD
jgi:hypothetical protein